MMQRVSWYLLFAMFGLISCVAEDEAECVTSFDCGDGWTCEAGFCIELPDDGNGIVDTNADKDTFMPDSPETDTAVDNDVTDGAAETDQVVDLDAPVDADETNDADEPVDEDEPVDVDNVVPVDECTTQTNPCDDNGDAAATCADTTDSYTCTCSFGFDATGGSCMDLDECTLGTDDCHANATCTNTTGLFTCACNSNYSGDGTAACDLCVTDGQCGATCAACGGGTLYCKDNGNGTTQCVVCTLEEHCPGAHCLLSDNTCVACRDNNDCNTGAGEVCFTATHTCGVNTCGDGVLGGAIPAFVEGFEAGMSGFSDGNWSTSTTQKHGGSYAMKTDTISDEGTTATSFIKYTDGQICFWYIGYSENYDKLYVYVDGSEKFNIGGNHQTWTQQCITVTAGYPTLTFEYTKDSSISSGWDAYYIDDIQFYNATTEQCETGQTSNCTTLGYDCGSTVTCGPDCTLRAGEAECHDDGGCGC